MWRRSRALRGRPQEHNSNGQFHDGGHMHARDGQVLAGEVRACVHRARGLGAELAGHRGAGIDRCSRNQEVWDNCFEAEMRNNKLLAKMTVKLMAKKVQDVETSRT